MRPSRRIERIARHDAESEPRIEARGLRILLIDIDTPHAAAGDGMVIVPVFSLLTPAPDREHVEKIFACYDETVVIRKKHSLEEK